jgi:signal peptidase I
MRVWIKKHARSILTFAAALAILPAYLWPYSLNGASAAPTILLGDTVIVNRAAYDFRLPYSRVTLFHTGSPQRGDIVQAHLPTGIGLGIKRIIGLPEETVEVRENVVIIDGRPLHTEALDRARFAWAPSRHRMGSTVVSEEGHWVAYTPGESQYRNSALIRLAPEEYFLMGDNRDNSFDSRAFGPVSRDRFVAKVMVMLPAGPRVKDAR